MLNAPNPHWLYPQKPLISQATPRLWHRAPLWDLSNPAGDAACSRKISSCVGREETASRSVQTGVIAHTLGRRVSSIASKDVILLSSGPKAVSFHFPHPLLSRHQVVPRVTWNQQRLPQVSDAVHAPRTLWWQSGASVGECSYRELLTGTLNCV